MRVLFVTPYYKPAHLGGIERAIERLAEALGRQDGMDRPVVLCARYAFPPRYVDGLAGRELTSEGLEVYRLSSWPHTPLPLFPHYSCPVTLFSTREVGRVLRDYRPDNVVIMNPIYRDEVERELAHQRCDPRVYTILDFETEPALRRKPATAALSAGDNPSNH